jgi:hypothetical protein
MLGPLRGTIRRNNKIQVFNEIVIPPPYPFPNCLGQASALKSIFIYVFSTSVHLLMNIYHCTEGLSFLLKGIQTLTPTSKQKEYRRKHIKKIKSCIERASSAEVKRLRDNDKC